MKTIALFVVFMSAPALSIAATVRNDDSCDIATAPAATLLLPYFEVQIDEPSERAASTLFTVVNTSREPQIAHVTVWTDWAWPVLTFNLFLTGYDVRSINLYDVLVNGRVAPPDGTANSVPPGPRSASNIAGNPNFFVTARGDCGAAFQGDGTIAPLLVDEVRRALTTGLITSCGTSRIGATHRNAIGYITIDVAATCSSRAGNDPLYYGTELLFDNTLIGDYQQIAPGTAGNFAHGGPMVHIRAIPEGGPAGARPVTNLPHTFYDRLTNQLAPGYRKADRRQPLPSTFAARFIEGEGSGFTTDVKIWREAITAVNAACAASTNNRDLEVTETIRFDERENPSWYRGGCNFMTCSSGTFPTPATIRVRTTQVFFPPMPAGSNDTGGWIYLNLDNSNRLGTYSTVRASQNWMTISMFAEGRYGVEFNAAALGNGCSPAVPVPTATTGTGMNPIGPPPDTTP